MKQLARSQKNTDITNISTISYQSVNLRPDMREDIAQALISRLSHEVKRSREAAEEMERLSDAYNRYLDLMEVQKQADARIKRIGGVMDSTALMGADEEVLRKYRALKGKDSDLPIWEAMAEYLSHVDEASIEDVQSFFAWLPFKDPSRPAIESALKAHKDIFKVTKRARGKFISLKR